jgi:hypothetical protein
MENITTDFANYSSMQLIIMLDGMKKDNEQAVKDKDVRTVMGTAAYLGELLVEFKKVRNISLDTVQDWLHRYRTGELN